MLIPKQNNLINKKKINIKIKIHINYNFSFYFQSKINSINFHQKIKILNNQFK